MKIQSQSAGLGNARTQFKLDRMYDKVLGTTQDEVEAVRTIRMAAELGDADAQNSLGL